MRSWVKGGGVFRVPPPLWCRLSLSGSGVGGPSPSLPGRRWPLAGVRQVGVALSHGCGRVSSPSGACGGLLGLDPRLVSLALVLWCALVRLAVSCCALPCCAVVVSAVLRCALLCRPVPRRVLPWCAVPWGGWLRRAVPCRAVSCCGVSCRGVPSLGALHGGALRCAMPFCPVWCRVSPCTGVRRALFSAVPAWGGVGTGYTGPFWWCRTWAEVMRLAGGRGARLGVVWVSGSVLQGSGCAVRVVGSGGCPRGCPPWAPVRWSSVLWGSLPPVLGVVAVSSSSSGACTVACVVVLDAARVIAWRRGCGPDMRGGVFGGFFGGCNPFFPCGCALLPLCGVWWSVGVSRCGSCGVR